MKIITQKEKTYKKIKKIYKKDYKKITKLKNGNTLGNTMFEQINFKQN